MPVQLHLSVYMYYNFIFPYLTFLLIIFTCITSTASPQVSSSIPKSSSFNFQYEPPHEDINLFFPEAATSIANATSVHMFNKTINPLYQKNTYIIPDGLLDEYESVFIQDKIEKIINTHEKITLMKYPTNYDVYADLNYIKYDNYYTWNKLLKKRIEIKDYAFSAVKNIIETFPKIIDINQQICTPTAFLFKIYNPYNERLLIKSIKTDMYQVKIFPYFTTIKKHSLNDHNNNNVVNDNDIIFDDVEIENEIESVNDNTHSSNSNSHSNINVLNHKHFNKNKNDIIPSINTILPRTIPPKETLTLQIITLADNRRYTYGSLYIEFNEKKILLIPITIKGDENKYRISPIYYPNLPLGKYLSIPIKIYNPHSKVLVIKEVAHSFKKINLLWPNGVAVTNNSTSVSTSMFEVQPRSNKNVIYVKYNIDLFGSEYGILHLKTDKDIILIPILINSEIKVLNFYPSLLNFGLCEININKQTHSNSSSNNNNIGVGDDSNNINMLPLIKVIPLSINNLASEPIAITNAYVNYEEQLVKFIYNEQIFPNANDTTVILEPSEEVLYGYAVFNISCLLTKSLTEDISSYITKHLYKITKGSIYIETNYTYSTYIELKYSYFLDEGKYSKVISGNKQIVNDVSYYNYKTLHFDVTAYYKYPIGIDQSYYLRKGKDKGSKVNIFESPFINATIKSISNVHVKRESVHNENDNNIQIHMEVLVNGYFLDYSKYYYIPLKLTHRLYTVIPLKFIDMSIDFLMCMDKHVPMYMECLFSESKLFYRNVNKNYLISNTKTRSSDDNDDYGGDGDNDSYNDNYNDIDEDRNTLYKKIYSSRNKSTNTNNNNNSNSNSNYQHHQITKVIQLDFGIISYEATKKKYFHLINDNPYTINITDITTSNPSITLDVESYNEILLPKKYNTKGINTNKWESNRLSRLMKKQNTIFNANANNETKTPIEIEVYPKSVLTLSINVHSIYDTAVKGAITVGIQNKTFLIFYAKATIYKGNLNIMPSLIRFEPAFSGSFQYKHVSSKSSYNYLVNITKVESSDRRIVPEILNKQIIPNNRTEIMRIMFDPSRVEENEDFLTNFKKGFEIVNERTSSTTLTAVSTSLTQNIKSYLTYKDLYLWKEKQKLWEKMGSEGLTEINSNVKITTDFQNENVNIRAFLTKPSLVKKDKINLGLVQIGETIKTYIEGFNPSDDPLTFQVLLASEEFNDINNNSMFNFFKFNSHSFPNLLIFNCSFYNETNQISERHRIIIEEDETMKGLMKGKSSKKEIMKKIFMFGNDKVKLNFIKTNNVICSYQRKSKNEIVLSNDMELINEVFGMEFMKEIPIIKTMTETTATNEDDDSNSNNNMFNNVNGSSSYNVVTFILRKVITWIQRVVSFNVSNNNTNSSNSNNSTTHSQLKYINQFELESIVNRKQYTTGKDALSAFDNAVINNNNEINAFYIKGGDNNNNVGDSSSSSNSNVYNYHYHSQHFFLPKSLSTQLFNVKPHQKFKIGPILFKPSNFTSSSATLFIKNNLTILYPIKLYGSGGSGLMRFLNTRSISNTNMQLLNNNKMNIEITRDIFLNEMKHFKNITRTITLSNVGTLPMKIKNISVDHLGCEGKGIKILQCDSFTLRPDENIDIDIMIIPDFDFYSSERVIYFNSEYQRIPLKVVVMINKDILSFKNKLFNLEYIKHCDILSTAVSMFILFCVVRIIKNEITMQHGNDAVMLGKIELFNAYDNVVVGNLVIKAYRNNDKKFYDEFVKKEKNKNATTTTTTTTTTVDIGTLNNDEGESNENAKNRSSKRKRKNNNNNNNTKEVSSCCSDKEILDIMSSKEEEDNSQRISNNNNNNVMTITCSGSSSNNNDKGSGVEHKNESNSESHANITSSIKKVQSDTDIKTHKESNHNSSSNSNSNTLLHTNVSSSIGNTHSVGNKQKKAKCKKSVKKLIGMTSTNKQDEPILDSSSHYVHNNNNNNNNQQSFNNNNNNNSTSFWNGNYYNNRHSRMYDNNTNTNTNSNTNNTTQKTYTYNNNTCQCSKHQQRYYNTNKYYHSKQDTWKSSESKYTTTNSFYTVYTSSSPLKEETASYLPSSINSKHGEDTPTDPVNLPEPSSSQTQKHSSSNENITTDNTQQNVQSSTNKESSSNEMISSFQHEFFTQFDLNTNTKDKSEYTNQILKTSSEDDNNIQEILSPFEYPNVFSGNELTDEEGKNDIKNINLNTSFNETYDKPYYSNPFVQTSNVQYFLQDFIDDEYDNQNEEENKESKSVDFTEEDDEKDPEWITNEIDFSKEGYFDSDEQYKSKYILK